jgi:hypothetical protein
VSRPLGNNQARIKILAELCSHLWECAHILRGSVLNPIRAQQLRLRPNGFFLKIGRVPFFRRMRRTITRIAARAFSRRFQSMVTLCRTLVTSSAAISLIWHKRFGTFPGVAAS